MVLEFGALNLMQIHTNANRAMWWSYNNRNLAAKMQQYHSTTIYLPQHTIKDIFHIYRSFSDTSHEHKLNNFFCMSINGVRILRRKFGNILASCVCVNLWPQHAERIAEMNGDLLCRSNTFK